MRSYEDRRYRNDRLSKLLVGTDFLLLHDGSVGQVGLVGCSLKQDYTTPQPAAKTSFDS